MTLSATCGEERVNRSAFCHEVAFYEDRDEFLETTLPYLRDGLEAGEPILVAVDRAKIDLLEAELGADAAGVRFADMAELGHNPARIIPAWHDFLQENLEPGGSVRGIGEPIWPGRTEHELDECQRHESLLNVAFGDGPAWSLLCPYDTVNLDDDVLEAARANHPYLRSNGGNGHCSAWRGLEGFSPFSGSLPDPPPASRSLQFDREKLAAARGLVSEEATAAGMRGERVADLAIAVGELVANSVRHGGGEGTLHCWREPGALFVEVVDRGSIEEPLVGRVRPDPTSEGGRGLWMANQLCDLVQIRSGPERTTVRLHMALS